MLKRSWEAKTDDKLQYMSLNLQKRAKSFEAAKAEPSDLKMKAEWFRREAEDIGKKRGQSKREVAGHGSKRDVGEETDKKMRFAKPTNRRELGLKKNQLGQIKTEFHGEKLDSDQEVLEIQSTELISKDKKLGREQSKVDLDLKTKKVQSFNSQIMIYGKDFDLKFKELKEFEAEINEIANELSAVRKTILDLDKGKFRDRKKVLVMPMQQQPSAPINHSSHYVGSVFSTLPEVYNPSKSVLDLVQGEIGRGEEYGLCESVLNKLILLLEELTKLGRFNEPQLQLKAQELAILWKEKIKLKAPALEVLAFLQFIVAYGLEKLINQEETALLASSISHYKQAPVLFHALGLKFLTPDFVVMLVRRRQYTPAVRLICEFKLKYFSPLQLLKEEILALKHSVMEKRQSPSQDEDEDGGKLRALLELVADYNLEIDIPGDLIVKLMVQREDNQIKSHLRV